MIYLLDLNYTLVENSQDKASPFSKQIEGERYRAELIESLKGKRVFMLTARPEKYLTETLRSMVSKTGWNPERYYFNRFNLPPPQAKEAMLARLRDEFTGETFFAIESNPKTRAMYAKHGVESAPWEVWLHGKT